MTRCRSYWKNGSNNNMLGFTECKGRWSRSGECLLVGSAYKLQEYILCIYIYTYHISMINVNLPRYVHNTLSVQNQLMVARFHPFSQSPSFVGLWGAKADCRATEVCTHGSVGCQGTRLGCRFGKRFGMVGKVIRLWSWTHHGGVKLDVNV